MNQPWKVLSTATLVAILTAGLAVPAFATTGDIKDKTTGITYSADNYNNSTSQLHALQALLFLGENTNRFTYDYQGSIFNYDKYNAAVTTLLTQGIMPTAAKLDAALDVTLLDAPVAATVASVSAINGTVTVTLSGVPTVAPVAGDFVVKQAIDGAEPTTVTPTLVMNGALATLTVAPVVATTADQTVVYSVSYKTVDTFFANNVTVLKAVTDPQIAIVATAETAVAVYEAAPITTLAEITTAEGLKAPADTAVNAVTTVAIKDVFTARITAKTTAIAAKKVELTVLTVTSVSAINLKEVVVTFDGAVDTTTATDATNYTANSGITLSAPTISADGKSVTLFADNNLSTTADTSVTVKNVKNSAGSVIVNTTKTVRGADTAIPTVSNVTVLGPTSIKVTFSEPVQNAGDINAYTLDSTPLAGAGDVAAFVANSHNKVVLITLDVPHALTTGQHNFVINDGAYTGGAAIADYAGYNLQPVSNALTVVADTTIPAVASATFVNQTTVQVTFNKAVSLAEATDYSADFYWNTNGTEGFTQYPADAAPTVTKVSDNTFNVSFKTNYLKAGTVYFFATAVKDFNGNAITTSKSTLTATADATVAVTGVTSTVDNAIDLQFNRTVSTATAQLVSNYTVTDAAGKSYAITSATLGGTNLDKVTLAMTANLPGGTYTVTAKNVKDILGNTIVATTQTVAITDTTPISTFTISAVNATNDKIVVTYPEAMATSGAYSIGNKARYSFRTKTGLFAEEAYVPLAADDTITTSADGKSATITFAANEFATTDAVQVEVALVADASGNTIASPIESNVYNAVDSITGGADVTSLSTEITGARVIQFTLPRQLSAISPVDFLINDGTTDSVPANAVYTNSTTDATSVVTLTAGADLDLTKTYKVKTNSSISATVDNMGIKVLAGKTTAAAVNAIAPNIAKFSVENATKIRVTFDKAMTLVSPGDFIVTNGTDVQTASAVSAAVAPGVYDLTISAIDLSATPTVKTVTSPQSEDAVGNKLNASVAGTAAGNFQVSNATISKGASATSIDGDETVVVNFTDPVTASSIKTGWNGATSTLATVVLSDTGESIAMPGLGTLSFGAANVITSGSSLANATYTLSADKKTVTVTLVDLAASDVNEGLPATGTFTVAGLVKSSLKDYVNVGATSLTATQLAATTSFAVAQTPITADNNFSFTLASGNMGLAFTDLLVADVLVDGTPSAKTINGVTYTVTYVNTTGVFTVTATGNSTVAISAATGNNTFNMVVTKDNATSNVLTVTIPDTALLATPSAVTVTN